MWVEELYELSKNNPDYLLPKAYFISHPTLNMISCILNKITLEWWYSVFQTYGSKNRHKLGIVLQRC